MVSSAINEMLERLRDEKPSDILRSGGPAVSVHSLTSHAGAFYEKLRYLVDYKEAHTIRRSAILRILKRKFSLEGEKKVGLPLLRELVSAEYLPNNQVSETVAVTIQRIVDKYQLLCADTRKRGAWKGTGKAARKKASPSKTELAALELAASEIDRMLFPQELNDAAVEGFYKTIKGTIRCFPPIPEEKLRAPLYIACRRTLLDDDPSTLLYILVSKYVPELEGEEDPGEIKALALRFTKALARARRELDNPLIFRIAALIRNRALGFSIIREIIQKHGVDSEGIFEEPERLETETGKILAEKYFRQNHTVWMSGVHAAIYILLTKSIFTLLLEFPYEWYLYQKVDVFALSVNVIFHPILLLLMVYTIAPLDSKNMARTLAIVEDLARPHRSEREDIIYIKSSRTRPITAFVLGLLYFALFAGTFGAIIRVLVWLHFSFVSIALFIFFLALVSYFGLRIRHNARRWKISASNENIMPLLWNFFTVPIVRTGRWLSQKFATVNIFVFVMDFIIETPFKILLGTFDSFLSFLKEKEEDMY
jgi:hypothetical protein